MKQLSLCCTLQDRALVALDHGLQIQILAHGAGRKLYSCLLVAAEKQQTVAQDAVAQRRRGLVEDEHIHIVKVQDIHQPADDLHAHLKTMVVAGGIGQEHSHIYIRKRPGLSAGVGAE